MTEQKGVIVLREFSPGSKSEGERVFLKTEEGEYVLRMLGGNPFHDEELRQLVGKRIVASGNLHGYTFIMQDWREE